MNPVFIYSTAILFVMLMDPFGNLPVFVATLRSTPPERFARIIFRESVFALIAMMITLILGRTFMKLLHIQHSTLGIAGGLILLLMGIKMTFSNQEEDKKNTEAEPFIVPLAIPLICGPGIIAMLVTMRGSAPEATFLNCAAALVLAWLIQTPVLLCGKQIAKVLGHKTLNAMESLMGLLLTCIAVGMLINGINETYGLAGK